MRHFLGFTSRDAANVQALAAAVTPSIPAVVDRFYEYLLADEEARAVLTRGERHVGSLRQTLTVWMHELFAGPYDQAYFEKRKRIGTTHVLTGLPQHFMFTGVQLIWAALEERLRAAGSPEVIERLPSLHRLLMLDLAIMLESYKDAYSEQVRDIEKRAMEARLTQAEHLAQIGQLAASLAHEIKNPLAGISGAIQIIRDAMGSDDPHRPILQEVLGQINRLDATVRDLLHFARPTPPKIAKVSLDAVVKRVLSVLREEPSLQRVRIEYRRSHPNTAVYADDAQVEQLLINLIINAAHASHDGGVIALDAVPDGAFAKLIVHDEGRGMPPAVQERAFEPFFTTKAKGTGLGLSICRRIVDAHNGEIELHSTVGRGTTVVVKLPHRHERVEAKATA